jgi:hypothetical protein
MLFAQRVFGVGVACVAGALLAFDPTWLFVARHDWGSVCLALGLRMGALWMATRAWSSGRPLEAGAAGLLAGLALYNKVDAVPFFAGAGIALLVCRPDVVRELLGARWRQLAWGASGAVVAALPLILSAAAILNASGFLPASTTLGGKAAVALATLDGSYFHRLIATGGVFGALFQVDAPSWGLPLAAAAGAGALVGLTWRGPARETTRIGARFLVPCWIATQAGLLAMPAADRVHHALNVYPLPHLIVAVAGVALWDAIDGTGVLRRTGRYALIALFFLLVASGARVIDRTADLVERTGGRGLWSDASTRLANELDRPEITFVCLDWGFQQTLAFQTERARLVDALWKLKWGQHQLRPWTIRGGPDHVYLLHLGDTDVFGFGAPFMEAVGELDPDSVEVETWNDREGQPAFTAVRILAAHVVTYRDGFHIRLP